MTAVLLPVAMLPDPGSCHPLCVTPVLPHSLSASLSFTLLFPLPSLSCLLTVCPLPNSSPTQKTRVSFPKSHDFLQSSTLCVSTAGTQPIPFLPSQEPMPVLITHGTLALGASAQVTLIVAILRNSGKAFCSRQPAVTHAANSASLCNATSNIQRA